MKRKTIFIILDFLAVIAIIIVAFKTSNTIQFFRGAEKFSVDEADEVDKNETGILLYNNIELHKELLDNKDSFRIVKNHFSEPWEKNLDESDLRHIYTDSFENDDFNISFTMIEQNPDPSKRFKFVWQISPKKNTSLSQYDFKVFSQGNLHWELENNQNNMLIRYSNKDLAMRSLNIQ